MEKSENGGGVWPGHSSEERGGVRATTRRVSGRARSRQDGAAARTREACGGEGGGVGTVVRGLRLENVGNGLGPRKQCWAAVAN
jgi:hypothetical protein